MVFVLPVTSALSRVLECHTRAWHQHQSSDGFFLFFAKHHPLPDLYMFCFVFRFLPLLNHYPISLLQHTYYPPTTKDAVLTTTHRTRQPLKPQVQGIYTPKWHSSPRRRISPSSSRVHLYLVPQMPSPASLRSAASRPPGLSCSLRVSWRL